MSKKKYVNSNTMEILDFSPSTTKHTSTTEVFECLLGNCWGHRLRRWKNKKHGKKPLEKVWESGAQARANCKHCKSFTGRFDKINAGCTKINRARTLAHYGAQSVLTMRHVHTPEEFTVAWALFWRFGRGGCWHTHVFSNPLGCKGASKRALPRPVEWDFFSEYYNLGSAEMELMDPLGLQKMPSFR